MAVDTSNDNTTTIAVAAVVAVVAVLLVCGGLLVYLMREKKEPSASALSDTPRAHEMSDVPRSSVNSANEYGAIDAFSTDNSSTNYVGMGDIVASDYSDISFKQQDEYDKGDINV